MLKNQLTRNNGVACAAMVSIKSQLTRFDLTFVYFTALSINTPSNPGEIYAMQSESANQNFHQKSGNRSLCNTPSQLLPNGNSHCLWDTLSLLFPGGNSHCNHPKAWPLSPYLGGHCITLPDDTHINMSVPATSWCGHTRQCTNMDTRTCDAPRMCWLHHYP